MKNKWSNYALKIGKVQNSYIREYSNRSPKREAREASRRDSILESWESQEEVNTGDKNESSREENVSQAHQEGRQGIQESDQRCERSNQRRCEITETDQKIQVKEKHMKEKVTPKERKHEAKEGKAFEKKEDKREAKKESKTKK